MLDMRRRELLSLLGGAAAAWPLAARAQQGERVRRIGVLMSVPADDRETQARHAAFLQGLQQLGWTEGRNARIEFRGATDADHIRQYAAELVALAPDVILAIGAAVTGPLRQATRTVPIVFVNISDPVGAGFVASLRHQTIPSHRPIGRRIGALRDRARCAAKLDIAAGGGPLGGVDLVVVAAN